MAFILFVYFFLVFPYMLKLYKNFCIKSCFYSEGSACMITLGNIFLLILSIDEEKSILYNSLTRTCHTTYYSYEI